VTRPGPRVSGYRGGVGSTHRPDPWDENPRPTPGTSRRRPPEEAERRFADDLIGLDPADPEARAFAEHLDRMERNRPGFTVEGYLGGVQDFADSANRMGGHRRMTAILLIALILLGVLVAVWDTLGLVLDTFVG
jgi:hypothetical protein